MLLIIQQTTLVWIIHYNKKKKRKGERCSLRLELPVGMQPGSDATAINQHNRIIPKNSIVKPVLLSENNQWLQTYSDSNNARTLQRVSMSYNLTLKVTPRVHMQLSVCFSCILVCQYLYCALRVLREKQ